MALATADRPLDTAMLDALPTNVMVADPSLTIRFVNRRAKRTLESLESALVEAFGVGVDDVMGGSIHRFHADPKRVEAVLHSPRGLPHEATFSFGGVTLEARIDALRDEAGDVAWFLLCWEDRTATKTAEMRAHQLTQMVDQAPTNVMLANRDLDIVYLNEASKRTLNHLAQYLPCPPDQLIGESVDIFHPNPAGPRRILEDPSKLPHDAVITLGEEQLLLRVTAIKDSCGSYLGPMLTWRVVTDERRTSDLLLKTAEQLEQASIELNRLADQLAVDMAINRQTAANAAHTSERIREAAGSMSSTLVDVAEGLHVIDRATQSTQEVSGDAVKATTSADEQLQHLQESSRRVSGVVSEVSRVASQTSLLALNATIEAARAGTFGAGFAVVAAEVKELASQTKDATTHIRTRIGDMTEDTDTVRLSLEEIVSVVQRIHIMQEDVRTRVADQLVASRSASQASAGAAQDAVGMAEALRQLVHRTDGTDETIGKLGRSAVSFSELSEALLSLVADLSSRSNGL